MTNAQEATVPEHDEQKTADTAEKPQEGAGAPNTQQEASQSTQEQKEPQEGKQGSQEDNKQTEQVDELPEWARTQLSEARRQAANYRTQLREAQDKMKNAKTVEEFEQVRSDFATQIANYERQLLIRDVADEVGLPKELAARLQGDDREALVADAKALARLLGATSEPHREPSGGLDPSQEIDNETPEQFAKRLRQLSGR